MALQECGLNLNRVSKELQPHGTIEFPCAGYTSFHTEREEDVIPWHWHDEMELVYMAEGKMKVKTPSKSFFWKRATWLPSILIFSTMLPLLGSAVCVLLFSALCLSQEMTILFMQKSIFSLLYPAIPFPACLLTWKLKM